MQLGSGWLHLLQPYGIISISSLKPLNDRIAIAALPAREMPTGAFVAELVLRSGERRRPPTDVDLRTISGQLHVTLGDPVPLEQWYGARLELRAKPQ